MLGHSAKLSKAEVSLSYGYSEPTLGSFEFSEPWVHLSPGWSLDGDQTNMEWKVQSNCLLVTYPATGILLKGLGKYLGKYKKNE